MKTLLNKYGRMALAVFVVTFLWMFIGNKLWVPTWPAFIMWACFYFIGASEEALKEIYHLQLVEPLLVILY